jgi:hypothetical protein
MRRLLIKILFFLLIISGLMLALYGMYRMVPEPPVGDLSNAREKLSLARKNNADHYSVKLYDQAKAYYDSAMVNWQKENKKFIYFRDYNKVSSFAELSAKKAIQAAENSKNSTTDLKTSIDLKIKKLNNVSGEISRVFTSYPLEPEIRNRISRGKFLLKETEIDFSKGLFLEANMKINEAESLLTNCYENAMDGLRSYFSLYPEWKKWIDKTIAESKAKNDYSIIIDKYSHRVFVYLKGTKKYEFTAELGRNWVGYKKMRGDKATPEGMYKVTRKFEKSSTKYYKALLIDYPNKEDSARFRTNVATGNLPENAKIGDMIEIHGNGGRGVDWTDGCIAVTDKDMDVLYKIIKIGTPVTIVGSVNDLEDVLNR